MVCAARVRRPNWLRIIASTIVVAVLIIGFLYTRTLPPLAVSNALGGRDIAAIVCSPDRVELAETVGRWWLGSNGWGQYPDSVFKPAGPYLTVARSDARQISAIVLNRTNYSAIGGNSLFPELLIRFARGNQEVELQVESKFDHVVVLRDGQLVGGCSLRP